MVLSTPTSSSKNTIVDGTEAPQTLPPLSSPDVKTLSSSVTFRGWRHASKTFKSWATKMAALHEPVWRKVKIFDAVMASTYGIHKNADLIFGIAENWCFETKTFVFPWGEATITLEDVMVLLGFSVLGSPVFDVLDSSGEMIKEKLMKEWLLFKKARFSYVTQNVWMRRFMDSGDELEHVAFLVLWLSYFVFPSRFHDLSETMFPIAIHLSSGTRIALAPAVLAHLYTELSLLKSHIRAFRESLTITKNIYLTSLFKLVQLWAWERFKEIRPRPNPLLKDEPRLARWSQLRQRTNGAKQILNSSRIDNFVWRPYTKALENWEFPMFYPDKAMWVPVGPSLDDEFISFARFIKVSELVGTDNVEHYFPNRVASQFGMIQDVPSPGSQNSLSKEAAWNDYNKPIDDLTLYIPSRTEISRGTATFCEWGMRSFPGFKSSWSGKNVGESAETLNARNITGHDTSLVPSGSNNIYLTSLFAEDTTKMRRMCLKKPRSKMNRTSQRLKDMKRARETDEGTMGHCQTLVPLHYDEEDDNQTIGLFLRLKKYNDVKYSEGDASESLGKKSRIEADNNALKPFQTGEKQKEDCLLLDKETMKSNEALEGLKRLEVLALMIEENITKIGRNVAWLRTQKTRKQ